jgi:hypothetical protein
MVVLMRRFIDYFRRHAADPVRPVDAGAAAARERKAAIDLSTTLIDPRYVALCRREQEARVKNAAAERGEASVRNK